ncbi:hypothetical protein McanCB49686_002751 [Microsporum canis]
MIVLHRAANDIDASVLDVRNATKAIFFLGTPHRGSNLASWGETMRNIVAISGFDTNSKNIRALRFGSVELEYAQDDFMQLWQQEKFIVRTFQEGLAFGGFNGVAGKVVAVVLDISSSLGDRREHAEHINANHREMCRYTGRDDPRYQQVGGELRRITKKLRFDLQKSQDNAIEAQAVISEDEDKLSSEELGMKSMVVFDRYLHLLIPHQNVYAPYASQKLICGSITLQMKSTLLRVKGKLGNGKSTSIKVAVSKLWNEKSSSSGIKLAFFFNNNGNALEKSQLGLFRSFLFQLFQQSKRAFQRFMPIFRRKVNFFDRRWTWSEEELKKFFLSVMTELSLSSAFIFIDALHECEEARDVITFFESLRISALENKIPVKLCYSSRHYPPIKVGDYVELRIDAHNNDDIENYIEKKLEPLFKRRHIDKLRSYIVEKAKGVFLWVVLVVGQIIKANDNGASLGKMQEIVEAVPDKLESLYREALKSANTKCPSETLLILQWMLSATRPITLLELRYALAFQTGEYKSQAEAEDSLSFIQSDQQMDLLHRAHTGGLMETKTQILVSTEYARQIFNTDKQTTIHFVYDSVKGFLLKHGGLQLFDSSPTDKLLHQGNERLAEACINYLDTTELRHAAESHAEPDVLGLTKSVELFQRLCRLHPFLLYSLNSVFEHIKAAESLHDDENAPPSYLYHRMEEIFFIWRYFSDLESKCRFHEVHGTMTTLAHLAAEHGLIYWIRCYLSSGGDVDLEGGRFGALLPAAAGMGHEEVVSLLLDHGADVHHSTGRLGSALSAATSEGHVAIAKTLIQRGSDVNYICGEHGCALQAAVCSPKVSSALVHVLLDAGADIHMQEGKFGTVLQAAAYRGDEEIVRILLARGEDANIEFGKYGTALGAAAFQGHDQVVQLLLEHGVDPATEAGNYGNSIWAAAYNEQGHVLRQILRHQWPSWQKDEVESKAQDILNEATRTVAFHKAVEDGEIDVVKEWIEDGIDPNTRGGKHSSARHIAVDMSDAEGRTPLWLASSDGHLEIAKMLLSTGRVDIRRKTITGRNLLWFAASEGRMDMVCLMREAGADPFEADNNGISPIMAAEEEGRLDVVLFLQKDMEKTL